MKAVIFDLGKVLVDYDHRQTLSALATLCRCDLATAAALFAEVDSRLGVGELDSEGLYQFCLERTALEADLETFVAAICTGLARNDEALAYAVALQQRPGITIGVISNTIEAHVSWLDEQIPELAELDLVMMSNEVGLTKPDP
ncbi:MAG TPA: hypothetical protein PKE45_18125, partial [Caldilineaceae bacterium]|nr:hypothetical protein [Caldilineaceae bacterium]